MSISELKELMIRLNKNSITAFTKVPIKCSYPVHYLFDNSNREFKTIEDIHCTIGPDIIIKIDNDFYIQKGILCLLLNDSLFDKNEIECTFCGCSTLLSCEEDLFDLRDL